MSAQEQTGTEMAGAQIIVQALIDQGVEVVFGYPGGAVLPIYDALFAQNSIRHILVRQEGGAVHVVGYVSAVSDKELTGDPLLELPGFRIGKNGIERVFDESLRGKAGSQRVEVNAYGRVIRELARQDGVAGDSVVLSIDAELQESIARRLSEESSAAVVM